MYVEENKPLAPFTSFGVGGPARWFIEASSEEDIAAAVTWAQEKSVPLFVLGGGSNLLVADRGFKGLVLRVGLKGVERRDQAHEIVYRVGAGEDWDPFVQRTVDDDCAGLECLAGIPGTVGGTPVQNVGAYGQEVADSIERVRIYDLQRGLIVEYPAQECGFAYRYSRFNTVDAGRYVVTRVDYRLSPGGEPKLSYADLQREFLGRSTPRLAEVAEAVRRIRRSKGMLLVQGDPDSRSAGSFFKNPVVGRELLSQLAQVAGREPPWFDPGPGAQVGCAKIPAAWLIEQAGFAKGFVQGRTGISSRHTLALINRGGAKATEILELANEIASRVEVRFGVRLEKEPVLLGFDS